jgi:large subunit ribosomal protein L17
MRHRVQGRKLGRTSSHRKALFRNQLTALFEHERIVTTLAKAKELRPLAERMVTVARTGTLAARRRVAMVVQDREIAKRLFEEIAPRFVDRPGGYTRILRLGRRRGDNAELAIIEFVDYELSEHQESGDGQAKKGSLLDRAKGMFGGGVAKTATDEPVEKAAGAVDDEPVETGPGGPADDAGADATDKSTAPSKGV